MNRSPDQDVLIARMYPTDDRALLLLDEHHRIDSVAIDGTEPATT